MSSQPFDPASARRSSAGGDDPPCDPEMDTVVLLEAMIHDLRTPLSAMSGWLEVLEAQLGGAAEPMAERALRGLRRSVDAQAGVLNMLSETLARQRSEPGERDECLLLERLQAAMARLEARLDSLTPPAVH